MVQPKHVICTIGSWENLDEVDALVAEAGAGQFTLDREFSTLTPEPRMTDAFQASYDRATPSMTDEDWQAIQAHKSVMYVLSPPIPKEEAIEISGQTLQVIAALLRKGGLAAKAESAGIAHGKNRWLQLAERYANAPKAHADSDQNVVLFVRHAPPGGARCRDLNEA
jgi:hypothetical protein